MSEITESFHGTQRFKIQQRLGSGGFGVVYQAYDREHETIVALKTLHKFTAQALYDLKKEFRSLADVTHTNLISLYELLAEEEQWFFTMELVDGVGFKDYLKNFCTFEPSEASEAITVKTGTLPVDVQPVITIKKFVADQRSLDYNLLKSALSQLAEGLLVLHDAGKLHRDIKPSNVLVTDIGRVVILDFGLVQEIAPRYENAANDDIVGTPAYMSPEQGMGSPLSAATDWYSVGVMLYQTLTGRLPFTGKPIEIIKSKLKMDPVLPNLLVPDIPEELNSLCIDLLKRDPAARPDGRELLYRLGNGKPPTRSLTKGHAVVTINSPIATALPFVGRTTQLAELRAAFQSIKDQRAAIVYVHGSSGMGKSTLVRHFLDEISVDKSQLAIFVGRCYQQESVPYKALDSIIDSLTAYLAGLSAEQLAQIVPADIAMLAQLFPVLRQLKIIKLQESETPSAGDSQQQRRRAFACLRELFNNLCRDKKIILFIDDLQWGDIDSALLLMELFGVAAPPPILLITTYRSEEAATSPLLCKLLAGNLNAEIHDLPLSGFDNDEARRLTLMLLGESHPEFFQRSSEIIGESGGNPFFVGELVRYILSNEEGANEPDSEFAAPPRDPAQTSLTEVIQHRVARLPQPARDLLELVAIAGQPLNLAIAREILDLKSLTPATIAMLRTGHFIRIRETAAEEEIESYHDRIREIISGHIDPKRFQSYNLQLGLALEAEGGSDPERLMNHFHHAERYHETLKYANIAAEQASKALAFDRAARLYRFALELCKSDLNAESSTFALSIRTLQVRLAESLVYAGRGAEAAEAYLEAAARTFTDERIDLRRRAAEQLLITGHVNKGVELLNDVLTTLDMKLAKTRNYALFSLMARRLQLRLRGLSFRERAAEEIPPQDLFRIDTCWSVTLGLSTVDTVRGADFQVRHLLLALQAGEPYRVARALAFEAAHTSAAGGANSDHTDVLLQTAYSLAKRINNPHAIGLVTFINGFAEFMRGHWVNAHNFDEQAEAIFRESCKGVSWELSGTHVNSLHSLLFLGDFNTVKPRLQMMLNESNAKGDLYAQTILKCRISYFISLVANRPAEAKEDLDFVMEKWSQKEFYQQHYWAMIGLAEVALYQNDPGTAIEALVSRYKLLQRSFMLQAQFLRIIWNFTFARCELAFVNKDAANKNDRSARLKRAEQYCKKVEKENMPWANPLSKLARAGIAVANQDNFKAQALLANAAREFSHSQMALYANVASYCRGHLLGGEEGLQLMSTAMSWMQSQQIKNPNRMIAMLAPGLLAREDKSFNTKDTKV